MAAGDLTTSDKVRAYLGLASGVDETVLAGLVSAVSQFIAGYCDRTFAQGSRTYAGNGTGAAVLPLPEYPVTAVESVTIGTQAIVARPSVGAAGWVLVGSAIHLDGGLRFSRGIANVTVVYTAGYAATPADLEHAANECCASWYRRRTRIDEQSKSVHNEVVSFSLADVPSAARRILDLYQRPWPR